MTRIGVDVGGTFTDAVSVSTAGELKVGKALTTPTDQSAGFLDAVSTSCDKICELEEIVHGTTVGTNAILERRGARTAFVTTAGFRDLLELQNQERRNIWDLSYEKAAPLVPRELCFEIVERMDAQGTPLRAPDRAGLELLKAEVLQAEAESAAICLLHAYRNDAHERAIQEVLADDVYSVTSARLTSQFREYDRASTTAMSAYIGPVLLRYLDRLKTGLETDGFAGDLLIMQSNGGVLPASSIGDRAIGTIFSGPAGGVIAAKLVGQRAGIGDVISFDMGGTSTDVCLVADGQPGVAARSLISGLPVITPMFQIDTVGAGGGSIAWVDDGGLLRVGPASAGSVPGPACYGRGGNQATVTDALVSVGILRTDRSLAGGLQVDRSLALRAMRLISDKLGTSELQAAEAVIRLANHRMSDAVRRVSLNQGHDPRDFALVAFGGAGPLHAAWVAEQISIRHVVVPLHAGVGSALGALSSDFRSDHIYSEGVRLSDTSATELGTRVALLVDRARGDAGRGAVGAEPSIQLDMAYAGQAHCLALDWDAFDDVAQIADRFHQVHARRYGFSEDEVEVELVNVRVGLIGFRDRPVLLNDMANGAPPVSGEIWLRDQPSRCTFVQRGSIADLGGVSGPAVVEEDTSTTFVPAGWEAVVDDSAQLHVRRGPL